jgi:hypothetical protein
MKTKIWCAAVLLGLASSCWAQSPADDPDWFESDAPPPPAFDLKRLIPFDVPVKTGLVFGLDPATLRVTPDGIVRYVVVASSPNEARNVLYEGLRCATAETKTYGWSDEQRNWRMAAKPVWRSLYQHAPSHHARVLAKNALCQGNGPTVPMETMVQLLKRDGRALGMDSAR